MTKTKTLRQIRFFSGNAYSRGLGRKLRSPEAARKLVKRLKRSGIEAFSVAVKVAA